MDQVPARGDNMIVCGLINAVGCFQVKYSSGKSLLLDLTYLNPTDDLNRELYKEIGNISKFGEQVVKVLNVEFSESSCGIRPSDSVDELDENQAKRRCPETRSTRSRTSSQETPEVALPVEVWTPPNVSKRHHPETSSTSTVPSQESPEVALPIIGPDKQRESGQKTALWCHSAAKPGSIKVQVYPWS